MINESLQNYIDILYNENKQLKIENKKLKDKMEEEIDYFRREAINERLRSESLLEKLESIESYYKK